MPPQVCWTVDGHVLVAIHRASWELASEEDRPRALMADTGKGKGVSFIENDNLWHCAALTRFQQEQAIFEIWGCGA